MEEHQKECLSVENVKVKTRWKNIRKNAWV